MACFHPIAALKVTDLGRSSLALPDEHRKIIFLGKKFQDGDYPLSNGLKSGVDKGYFERLELPCGNCIGCRLEKSRQWALRCMHEAKDHEYNCFLTLTYNSDIVGDIKSLNKTDIVKFMKDLRSRVQYHDGLKIRFFQCGEYGDQNLRPHHHVLIFGYDFPDKVRCVGKNGYVYYRSAELEKLWPYGYSAIGDLTFDSACYVARYVLKKLNGDAASFYSDRGIIPPYITMSRRPGIGKNFFDRYHDDIYPKDFISYNDGLKLKPPKYYDKLYENLHADDMEKIKKRRKFYAESVENKDNVALSRLKIREQAALFRQMNKKRNIDNYGNISEYL